MANPGATTDATHEGKTTYRVLRELARRSQRSFIAVREAQSSTPAPVTASVMLANANANAGASSIVVMNRFVRDVISAASAEERVSSEQIAILLRDARCLEKNWHPNVARVRHVDLVNETLHVATELVDGVTLADLITLAKEKRALHSATSGKSSSEGLVLPAPILARIFLDVLSGLTALHALRDGINKPLSLFHGELCPANIVIGKDGVARIVNVFRPRPVTIGANSEALRYASPETLAGEVEQDARADVYAIGVMLWEALMGRPLYTDDSPARIAQRQREEDVAHPSGPLAEVAMRALAFDPALRFRTAQDALTHLRVAARSSLAAGGVVAQTVLDLAGDRIRSRRLELEPLLVAANASRGGRTISGQRRAVQLANAMQSGTHVKSDRAIFAEQSRAHKNEDRAIESAPISPKRAKGDSPLAFGSEEVETSYARRPATAIPLPPPPSSRRTPPLPLPPPSAFEADDDDDDDDDFPGPRASTPDVSYLDELAAAAALALDANDLKEDEEDDDNDDAIHTARRVSVSVKSTTPVPPPPPSFPKGAAVFSTALPASPATTTITSASASTAAAASASVTTTRTPFVVDVFPASAPPDLYARPSRPSSFTTTLNNAITAWFADDRRRLLTIVAVIGTAALFMLMVGAALIARRAGSPDRDRDTSTASAVTEQHQDPGPSTAIIPPAAVDSLPPAAAASSTKPPQK